MKIIYFFFLFFLYSILPNHLYAAHIMGGSMHYTYRGNNQYDIEMVLYKSHGNGEALFDSASNGTLIATVSIFEETNLLKVLELDSPKITRLSQGNSACIPSIIEKATYFFTVELNDPTKTYTISYQRCCRNIDVVNILNPVNTGITLFAEITPISRKLSSSAPYFANDPSYFAIVNEPFLSDHSAIEPEGLEEISYSFCAPYTGGGLDGSGQGNGGSAFSFTGVAPDPESPPTYAEIEYRIPYSGSQPLGQALNGGIFSIDAKTGIISGTPTVLGTFVLSVCATKYRHGNELSKTIRDIHMTVMDCTILKNDNINDEFSIHIMPNPSDGQIKMEIELYENSSVKIELINLTGQILSTKSLELQKGLQVLDYDQRAIANGTYFMKIDVNGKVMTKKVFIIK